MKKMKYVHGFMSGANGAIIFGHQCKEAGMQHLQELIETAIKEN